MSILDQTPAGKLNGMMQSYFAPPARAAEDALRHQIDMINDSPLLGTILSVMGGVMVILNENRQIIGLNDAFLVSLGINNSEEVLGFRLGETLGCVHAHEMEAGCGTARTCASCGAAIAMLTSLNKGQSNKQLCAVETIVDGVRKSMLLQIHSCPIIVEKQCLLVVAIKDVTEEQIRANLERVFYHDINNILASLLGAGELLLREMPHRWEVKQVNDSALRLRQEIALQRNLRLVDRSDFVAEKKSIMLGDINGDVELLMRGLPSARGRSIEWILECNDCRIISDKLLISRILANMLINALEATFVDGSVKFINRRSGDNVIWQVWNRAHIPRKIQKRIFQRYFSTKEGMGRGLGTFSMKEFGEKYLHGRVQFTTSKEKGTTFTFILPVNP